MYKHSRRAKTEEKKNVRSAFVFGILTLIALFLLVGFGLPAVAKFAAFLTDLRGSSRPVEFADTTPPPPPRLEPLPSAVNTFTVEVRGNTEAGATVTLFLNNKEEELLANNSGEFSYSFSLNDGENTVSVMATDNAGNESQKTEIYNIIYDNEPPILEVSKPEDGSEYYGSKQRQIVIEGNTEEGVQVKISGRHVVVSSDGSFSFATTLSEGENKFDVIAQDEAENTTEKAITVNYTP